MKIQTAARPSAELDELTLMRAQRAEPQAERALIERYQGPVFALISRMLARQDRSATEDLAQETFLRVFRALPGFDRAGSARLSGWIFTIATRVTIDHLRRARVRAAPVEGEVETAARGPEIVERRELARAMERALAALPAEQRAAFVLFYYHERSHAQIAATLEVEVEQPHGSVFYRVERGGQFVVRTPAGEIAVTGTSFQVEVPMKGVKMAAVSGVAGAALATAAWVTVYEGSVEVGQKGDAVVVEAGQQAALRPGLAPALAAAAESRAELLQERAALRARTQTLEGQIKELLSSRASDQDPVVARNRQLEAELEELRASLDEEHAMRKEHEGEHIPFPAELGERYREAGLKKAFEATFTASGIEGEVAAIDCNEFPCIVYGEFSVSGDDDDQTGRIAERFWDALKGEYPEPDHSTWISHSKFKQNKDGEVSLRNMFGVAVTPKEIEGVDEQQRKEINRRMRWRNQQYMDAIAGGE